MLRRSLLLLWSTAVEIETPCSSNQLLISVSTYLSDPHAFLGVGFVSLFLAKEICLVMRFSSVAHVDFHFVRLEISGKFYL